MTEKEVAQILLELLYEYLTLTHVRQDYWEKVSNKRYKAEEESRELSRIEAEYARPLVEKCRRYGFAYSDLLEIIPPAFNTTNEQRSSLVLDLDEYSEEMYGTDIAIPF